MIVRQFLQWIKTAPPARRADAAHALARAYLHSKVDEETRNGVEAAMTLLLDDPSPGVRFALADALALNPNAPRHVIINLAGDQDEIATLILSRTPVLIDSELVDIVAAAAEQLQVAVASRPWLSSAVAAAVAEVGEQAACMALIGNELAAIARISFRRMAERFGHEPIMREALLARSDLPPNVRHMLVRQLADVIGDLGMVQSCVGGERARALVRDACDQATVAIAAESELEELPALVEHLRVTGQLTTALLLRAVCAGNIAFFETALATLSAVPEERVASLVQGGRTSALRAVYDRAGLPPRAFDAFVAAIEACRDMAAEDAPVDRYHFTQRLVACVLARYEDITDGEMNGLAAMLRRFAADQARAAAREYARTAIAAA